MGGKVLFWLLSAAIAVAAVKKTFHGDKLISITPHTDEQLDFLQLIERNTDVDFWKRPQQVGSPVEIHLSAQQLSYLGDSLKTNGMTYEVKIQNIQALIDNEKMPPSKSRSTVPDVLRRYGTQPEIYSWLETMAQNCGTRCKLMYFGRSVENRTMQAIKITASDAGANTKPSVFIDGGIHAREWISPAFVNNMIDKLINSYGSDTEVTNMLDVYDFYIIPLLNPDGYHYSHQTDRMWRKNRAETYKKRCVGVDLNRNFGIEFGVSGVSSDACSEIYNGPRAFSEPESQALRDFLYSINNLEVYLSFHSYGQYFLYPWGYARINAPNYLDMKDAGNAAAAVIKEITGSRTSWTVGNSAIALYPTAGASDDWAYSVGATYSYCVELPPADSYTGFLLPESRIPEVVNSVWPGIKALMSTIIQKQSAKAAPKQSYYAHDTEFWARILEQKLKSSM